MRTFSASADAVEPLEVWVGGGTYHLDKRVLPWRFCRRKNRIMIVPQTYINQQSNGISAGSLTMRCLCFGALTARQCLWR
mmetsp:Transcript_29534/g.68704  ORF Transcript_29534/g.68704 Transcript_29534/m.68704 type:complete len:80 (+) Transcript_29534:1370-1609(+)